MGVKDLTEIIAVGKTAPDSDIVNRQLCIKQKLNSTTDADSNQILDRTAADSISEMQEEIPP